MTNVLDNTWGSLFDDQISEIKSISAKHDQSIRSSQTLKQKKSNKKKSETKSSKGKFEKRESYSNL